MPWKFFCAVCLLATVAVCLPDARAGSWDDYEQSSFEVDGRACTVVVPKEAAPGRPWVWRARFPGYHPDVDRLLLGRGFHIAWIDTNGMLGSDHALDYWDRFYDEVRNRFRLSETVALEAVSRGGLFTYRWAARHPQRVACIYADTPVCDIKSWPLGDGRGRGDAATWKTLLKEYGMTHDQALQFDKNPIDLLDSIAAARIPILHIVSENDAVVPPAENTYLLQQRYQSLGGYMRVISVEKGTVESFGHHFDLVDPLTPADFITTYTIGSRDWFLMRRGLPNCRVRFEQEQVGRVAFLGGSITHNPGWREMVCEDLRRRFPETQFQFINAGIPSMGSTPGAFRLQRDVLSQGPIDLLFVEAAVNDSTNGRSPLEMLRGMEGIVRHALTANAQTDIVVMHFVDPGKMASYNRGREPEVIRVHESVARHYDLTSINLALEVTQRINAGEFSWQKDFKNLHPSPFGQQLYFQAIRRMLAQAWKQPSSADAKSKPRALPPAMDPHSYTRGRLVGIDQAQRINGWTIDRAWKPADKAGTRAGFVGVPMLVATDPGATMKFAFRGTAVGIFVAAGPDAGTVQYSIDGSEFRSRDLYTRWSGGLHLPWAHVLATDLVDGEHELTLRIGDSRNPTSKGSACRIAWFLVN